MEPIHAVVLPRGKSLDHCAEVLQKRTAAGKAGAHRPPKCRGQGSRPAGRPPPHSVFDFLNEKLRGQAPGALEAGAAPPGRGGGKETYHASKSAKRALSLRLFQTEEKIEQTQRDIRGIQEALARNTGRYVWGRTQGEGGIRGGLACGPAAGARTQGWGAGSEEGLEDWRVMGSGSSGALRWPLGSPC